MRQYFWAARTVPCFTYAQAEALHAGTALSGDELDDLRFDSIPEPHHGLARTGTGGQEWTGPSELLWPWGSSKSDLSNHREAEAKEMG